MFRRVEEKKLWLPEKFFWKKMRSKKKIARKWGKNHVPLLYDVHLDPWTDGPNHWNSGDFRCLKVDIGTRFHFRSFLIDFDEKYGSNGSKIWAGGIHPPPAYTSTKKPGQIRVKLLFFVPHHHNVPEETDFLYRIDT